jgi:hypothetical protein
LFVGPTRDRGQGLSVEQPRDILFGDRGQVASGDQADEPVPLPAPGLE